MKNMLLVEDNPTFAAAAIRYVGDSPDTKVHHAADYAQASYLLKTSIKFDGAYIDCFFANQTGSNDLSLGKSLVEELATLDPLESKIRRQIGSLRRYVDLDDVNLAKYARLYFQTSEFDFMPQNMVLGAIKAIGLLSKSGASYVAFKFMKSHEDKRPADEFHPKGDYYGSLMEAMEQSEANQPLGILIARELSEKGIPFVLTTSSYHHDMLTQPLYDYANKEGWRLVDALPIQKNAKETLEFWAIAQGRLGRPLERG